MDFYEIEEEIKNYVASNFGSYTGDLPEISSDNFVHDFLDFDKYRDDNVLFFAFPSWTFDSNTIQSDRARVTMHVYIKCEGEVEETLHQRCEDYASAFYSFFNDMDACGACFGGVIDFGRISEVEFYEAAEGNKGTKVCDISIDLQLEAE